MTPSVATTPEVDQLLAAGAAVAIGVSGGKDSCAAAFATVAHLDAIGHVGPRVLIHSDLGRVEWKDSLPTCERLAAALGLELVVVRRGAGDMMDRWLARWASSVRRYADLSCVKVILPWSTPDMRFCTSELKTQVICRELRRRFAGSAIVSVAGIRRAESPRRRRAPVSKPKPELAGRGGTHGIDWHPIIEWSTPEVFEDLATRGFQIHEAYTRYGMSRVSCAFCIMSNAADLVAAATCSDNAPIYREMVDLEIASTFAFQGDGGWLGDVAPHLLTADQRSGLTRAKERAGLREAIEANIPEHLLYTKGWPTYMPTEGEARLLASVRREVARVLELEVSCTTAAEVTDRYRELMAQAAARRAA